MTFQAEELEYDRPDETEVRTLQDFTEVSKSIIGDLAINLFGLGKSQPEIDAAIEHRMHELKSYYWRAFLPPPQK